MPIRLLLYDDSGRILPVLDELGSVATSTYNE